MSKKNEWIKKIDKYLEGFNISNMDSYISGMIDEVQKNIKKSNIGKLQSDVSDIYKKIKENDIYQAIKDSIPPEHIQLCKDAINNNGGIKEVINLAWSLEEKKQDCLTFEDLISWITPKKNQKKHSGACFYVKKFDDGSYEAHLCFLDKTGNAILDGSECHLIVYTKCLDDVLIEYLADKEMLVLR